MSLPTTESPERRVAPPRAVSATRMRAAVRKGHNWRQLARFCIVGASGYVVNLVVFAICVGALNMHHLAAATVAFLVAVTNNFAWNHSWTFGSPDGKKHHQALQFFVVSTVSFAFSAGLLEFFVSVVGLAAIVSQAIAIMLATPLNFVGNKLWTFNE